MLQSGCLGNAEIEVCQCVCVCWWGGGGGGGSHYNKSLYSGSLAVLAKLWSSVMWRFTVKKSPRGCGKLQLYQAVFGFYLFGGSLFTLRDCRLLGDCEEIVKVECILLYLYSYTAYTRSGYPLPNSQALTWDRGTHREYSSKPLKHTIFEVFKR